MLMLVAGYVSLAMVVLVSHYYPTPIAESLNLLSDLSGGSGRHSASSYDTSSGISSKN